MNILFINACHIQEKLSVVLKKNVDMLIFIIMLYLKFCFLVITI